MKCPTCESCEYEQYCGATEIMRKCERHNKKVKQTNEEWFCFLTTEEKAKVLRRKTYGNGDENKREEKGWENWFKAEHQDNPPDIPNVPSWEEWLKEEKMKCSRCGGTSDVECEFYGKHECPYQPMTNEEWMKSLDTEELVDHLYEVHKGGASVERQAWIEKHKERIKMQIRKWLKEKHNVEHSMCCV